METRLAGLLTCALLLRPAMGRPAVPEERASYQREIETWRANRIARLAGDDGWLTVVGLTWLKEGSNSFGSDPASEVALPGSAPAHAGVLRLSAGHVRVELAPGTTATVAGQAVTSRPLRSDAGSADPDILALGSVTLQIIERGGRDWARA